MYYFTYYSYELSFESFAYTAVDYLAKLVISQAKLYKNLIIMTLFITTTKKNVRENTDYLVILKISQN